MIPVALPAKLEVACDVYAVLRWAESVRFDAMLLDCILDGSMAISTFGPPRPWKRLWRLELFECSASWLGLSHRQFLKLRRAGASDGDLRWADYTKRNELQLNDVLGRRCEIVGIGDDGEWEFGWISGAATPLQLNLFDDIAGSCGWQWRSFSPAESRLVH